MTISNDVINQLSEAIDQDRLINRLCEMIAVPSVNPFDLPATEAAPDTREQAFAQNFVAALQHHGLETEMREVVPGRPNVFARRSGSDSGSVTVMLAGHLDTVGVEGYVDPFNPVVKNNRVYGRGACDMKAALAAYVEVAQVINEAGLELRGDLIIAGVADEEHKMIGSKEISLNGPRADFAIIGEPTELSVCYTHKGQLSIPIKTFGKAAHSSMPENGINAITAMGRVLQRLEVYADELQRRTPHAVCGYRKVNAGVIKGGTISCTVPDYCELEIDRRTLSGETQESVRREYAEMLQELQAGDANFSACIGETILDNPPLDTPMDSAVVTAMSDAVRAVTGCEAQVGAFPAATDAPNFLCPAVVCGPGSLLQAHTLDEYVEISELVDSARIYLRAVLQLIA